MIATECPVWCANHLSVDEDRHESVGCSVDAASLIDDGAPVRLEVRAAVWADDGERGPLSTPHVVLDFPPGGVHELDGVQVVVAGAEVLLTPAQADALAAALQQARAAITDT